LTGFDVATMAVDSQYHSQSGSEAVRPPVSLHPAFRAIVALWFAALLGIGSLVLPAALLERVVSASGLASLLPAASPPLGLTARALIAVIGALAGAALGIAVARRVAGAHAPQAESRAAKLAAVARRPISVHDELGGEGLTNGESLPISHRRALAISEDDRPSDFLYRARLPGEDLDAPAPFAAAPIVTAVPDDEPLELSELVYEDEGNGADGDLDMTDASDISPVRPSHQHYAYGLEPLPFAAPSLARRTPEPESEPDLQLETVAVEDAVEVRADWQTAPLGALGLVQLVQRLGATIERRRELMANAAALPSEMPAAFAEPDFEPAAREEAVQAMAAFFGSAPALQPRSLLGMKNPCAPKSEFVRVEEPDDEAELAEPAVVFPGQQEPATSRRLFDPPGVLGKASGTPAAAMAAPRAPADADAALRAALATLQRMSGAA
jgi:hypothetical protein